jgi:LPP20 lipoprotein
MITKKRLPRWIGGGMLAVMILTLTACSGAPKWVKQGSNFNDKAFYGVGAVNGVKNEPLAWEAAQNRARAEVARNFETYTAYLMRDYAASTTAGDFTRNTEEQNIERAIKTFSAVTLSGVRQEERYKDEKTGTYYVLAKLNLADVKEQLAQAKELNGQVRDFVRRNADRLFERLEKEEDKKAAK